MGSTKAKTKVLRQILAVVLAISLTVGNVVLVLGAPLPVNVNMELSGNFTVSTGTVATIIPGGVVNGTITVEDGATLTIDGGQVNGFIIVEPGGTLNLISGTITSTAPPPGSGITSAVTLECGLADTALFNMSGGLITGAGTRGVDVGDNAMFEMTGGEISGNSIPLVMVGVYA